MQFCSNIQRFFLYILVICLFFLYSCTEEYRDHFFRENYISSVISWEQVSSRSRLYILPSINALEDIVYMINNAQKTIWVEIYTWTEKSTIEAVLSAKKRGVDVRVILEGNVYGTPFINKHTFDSFSGAGIPTVYADNSRYTFTHTKFWIIDNYWCIATGNLTYSSFTKNRDMIYCDDQVLPRKNLESLFLSDFDHKKPIFLEGMDSRLWISPMNMRSWIQDALSWSKHSLFVYNQTITDPEILNLLEQRKRSGIDVKLCSSWPKESLADQEDISHTGTHFSFPFIKIQKPYPHLKVFLVDGRDIILWSINLTQNALDNNRETAFLIKDNPKIYSQVKNTFLSDCFDQKFAK